MMKENSVKEIADFRDYRPAAVILIDLVKHSKRRTEEIHVIQKVLEDILSDTMQTLSIKEAFFQHTGDGWMCTLFGNDSARAMDFCNLVFTSLYQRLEPYSQSFRAGVDYGLVHFRETPLSTSPAHFDSPGICSARLEAAAETNQILCTSTIYEIFSPHYADMFSDSPAVVKTKDRNLASYTITPRPLPTIRSIISKIMFADIYSLGKMLDGNKKILVVDDEEMTTHLTSIMLGKFMNASRIVVANSGEEALVLFKPNDFVAVLTDIVMPGMSGVDLARRIFILDPEVPVVLMTGYRLSAFQNSLLDSGIVMRFQKPMHLETVLRSLAFALAFGTPSILKNRLQLITDKPTDFLHAIGTMGETLHHIIIKANDPQDVAHGLLRHKAKQIVNEALSRLIPGGDVVTYLEIAVTQLKKLELICFVVCPLEALALEIHIRNMIEDYSKANPKINFDLSCELSNAPKISYYQSIVLLIVSELIDNAIDAVAHNGKIGVDISWDRTRQLVRMVVTDNGSGIPENSASGLFKANITTKGDGRGMGLPLVNDACEAMKGSVSYIRDDLTTFMATIRPDHHFEVTSKEED